MNIDLSNKWVAFLVGGADLSNGCSVIRNILLRSIVLGLGAIAGTLGAIIAGFVVSGLVLYLFSPWFGRFDVALSLSWLGPSWWAELLRIGAVIGLMACFIASVVGALFSMVRYGPRAVEYVTNRQVMVVPMSKTSAAISTWYEAAMAFGHRFCPKITFTVIGPESVRDAAQHPQNYMFLDCAGEWYKITGITPSKADSRDTRFDVRNMRYDSPYFFMWKSQRNRWDDDGVSLVTKAEYERVLIEMEDLPTRREDELNRIMDEIEASERDMDDVDY